MIIDKDRVHEYLKSIGTKVGWNGDITEYIVVNAWKSTGQRSQSGIFLPSSTDSSGLIGFNGMMVEIEYMEGARKFLPSLYSDTGALKKHMKSIYINFNDFINWGRNNKLNIILDEI